MAVVDQYKTSTLGLLVRHNVEPQRDLTAKNSYWGYRDPSANVDPALSQLHGEGFFDPYTLGYSVDGTPNVRVSSFGDISAGSTISVKQPSLIDELDPNAPNNTQIGKPVPNGGPVVSQIYKSPTGQRYRDLGPTEGRY
jgi:hypothetical protein